MREEKNLMNEKYLICREDNKMSNGLIEISGLCETGLIDPATYPFWTEISVPEKLFIPCEKPDIEQIDSVNVAVNITRKKVIVTPTSPSVGGVPTPSFEGKVLTGRKLIVEGEICQTITYTADVDEQPVHSAHFAVPFSAYIVVDETFSIGGEDVDALKVNFNIIPCVEDVFIQMVKKREIFKNVTLLLQAIPAGIDCRVNACN